MISIVLFCLILDTLLIKIVENVYKNLISITGKIIFFFILSFLCLFVQFILITYFKNFFKEKTRINIQRFYLIFVIGIVITGSLIGFITYQMLFSNHYDKILLIIITLTNYFNNTSLNNCFSKLGAYFFNLGTIYSTYVTFV